MTPLTMEDLKLMYNNEMNEINEQIEIHGKMYDASDIVKALDYDAYIADFNFWFNDQLDEGNIVKIESNFFLDEELGENNEPYSVPRAS